MEDDARQDRSNNAITWIIVVVVVAIAAFAGWYVGRSSAPTPEPQPIATPAMDATPDEAEVPETIETGPRLTGDAAQRAADLEALPSWSPQTLDDEACAAIDEDFASVCEELGEDACVALRSAAIELSRSRPEASGELYDHESVLSNAFHLFRVLGRADINQLRAFLEDDDAPWEVVALSGYRWLASRPACGRGDEKQIDLPVLHDYAVYATTTLGGQAYLRRRAPRFEGLAAFYALITMDRAIRDGRDPHGVDPRASMERAAALLDDGSLLFHESYLDVLDQLRERWRVP
jgi:hypothetical protein